MSDNDPIGSKPNEDDDGINQGTDPRESVAPSPRSQVAEVVDLSERFSQQQVMISKIKEMVMAEEAARTQKIASSRLKMEKCVSQLARIRDRAKSSKLRNTPDSTLAKPIQDSTTPIPSESHTEIMASPPQVMHVPQQDVTPLSQTDTASTTVQSIPQKSLDHGTKSKASNREVTKMLHQQIKEHKAMIAERAKNEKELEMALAKIQKQLEESQNQSAELLQLGQSKTKTTIPSFVLEESIESNKVVHELRHRISQLEGTIMDLQETCKEKDSVIDSKTKAITLMSADLSKKGKNTLDLLDDTKEQMQKMQENFASMENEMKLEKQKVLEELDTCRNRIIYLEEANEILENERFSLSVQNSNLEENLALKETEVEQLRIQINKNLKSAEELAMKVDKSIETDFASREEKGSKEISEMNALSEKIEILEKLNSTLRQANIELQEKINPATIHEKQLKEESPKPSKKGKSVSKPKGSQKFKNQNTKVETEKKDVNKDMQDTVQRLENIIQSLNKQILEKEILLSQKEVSIIENKESSDSICINESVETIEKPESENKDDSSATDLIKNEGEIITENIVKDIVVEFDNESVSIDKQLENALNKIGELSKELADANKNMVKIKASHKAKLKQMQKSIDDFSKVSDSNTEVVRLQSELGLLTQKIAELEEDKGNLQLHLVDYDSGRVSDSQLHAKLLEMENLAEERLKAIADLETQKFDLVQELHFVKQQINLLEDKVADLSYLENEHVSSELKSAQLEEQIDILTLKQKDASEEVNCLKVEKDDLLANIESLKKEKAELSNKLDLYLQENMDLIDRLDKLSAEKVSSAESIEMVESLTSQEKMELEQYQKSIGSEHHETSLLIQSDKTEELVERDNFSTSDPKNTELETNIDLFNQERHEVMDKIDILKNENNTLSLKLEELYNDKKKMEDKFEWLSIEKENFIANLKEAENNNTSFMSTIELLKKENCELLEKIVVLEKDSKQKDYSESGQIVEIQSNSEVISSKSQDIAMESKSTLSKSPKGSSPKDSKNHTKEILRLKNVVKHQESEIKSLHDQLSEQQNILSQNEILIKEKELLSDGQQNLKININNLETKNVELCTKLIELENSFQELAKSHEENIKLSEEKDISIRSLEEEIKNKDKIISNSNTSNEQLKGDINLLNVVIQSKDDEIAQCVYQINQLDSVSKKLKSIVTQYEEESSANMQYSSTIKNLENNIVKLKNTIADNDNKIKDLESKLLECIDTNSVLNNQIMEYEGKIRDIDLIVDNYKKEISNINVEKDNLSKEINRLKGECLSKDEEIHEIKLELRKESIAHDKMKDDFKEIENNHTKFQNKIIKLEEECTLYKENEIKHIGEYESLDKKYKEQLEKLKKFAAHLKKKTSLCSELEGQIDDLKTNISELSQKLEESNLNNQKLIQDISILNTNCNLAQSNLQQSNSSHESMLILEEQISALKDQIVDLNSQNNILQAEINSLNITNTEFSSKISLLTSKLSEMETENQNVSALNLELSNKNLDLSSLLSEMELKERNVAIENISLINKIEDYNQEIDNIKLKLVDNTKMQEDILVKENDIKILTENIQQLKLSFDQFSCGQEAKIQEKDVYIENLEGEILKHKDRISRLEDSVSTMEERRSSLERKTDKLVIKLSEKDAECSESSFHEDELEKRLAILIQHDELIQKQLDDTLSENNSLSEKVLSLSESNKSLKVELDVARSDLNSVKQDFIKLQSIDEERVNANERISYLENELKRLSIEYSQILKTKTTEYEFLESELHSLMKNNETQRRASKDQFDKLQDELSSQSQALIDLQSENDWLKSQHENMQRSIENKHKQEIADDVNNKLKEYLQLLEEKDNEISKLSIQLQFVSSGNVFENRQSDNKTAHLNELELEISQKNLEIEKLDSQFKACLLQLTESIESEKCLKQTCSKLSQEIQDKNIYIDKLQIDLKSNEISSKPISQASEVYEFIPQPKSIQSSLTKIFPTTSNNSDNILDADSLKNLEEQILYDVTNESKNTNLDSQKHMIRNFEHDPAEAIPVDIKTYFESTTPIAEESIHPKSTYLCYKQDEVPVANLELSGENFDNDGWGLETQIESTEDEQIQNSQSMSLWNQTKISELESNIERLEKEKNKLSAELLQSQQKTAKALLKLKEFKRKNDALNNEIKSLKVSSDFNMLDMAIQDELSTQVKKLEEKIKEMTVDASKEKIEKDNLLKRIDVLTSANEKLMEMKERQDIEMAVCQSQNKGLSDKIKNLEWDNTFTDDVDSKSHLEQRHDTSSDHQHGSELLKNINNLNKKIADLEADNEELQAFIEEQQVKLNNLKSVENELENIKNNVLAEVTKENELLKENFKDMAEKCNLAYIDIKYLTESHAINISELNEENAQLKEKVSELRDQTEYLNSELILQTNNELVVVTELKNENTCLRSKIDEINNSYITVTEQLYQLKNHDLVELIEVKKEYENLKHKMIEMVNVKPDFELIVNENVELKNELMFLEKTKSENETIVKENLDLKGKLEALIKEYYEFQEKYNEMANEKDKIEMELNNLMYEKEKLDNLFKDISEQETACKSELLKISYENEELNEKYDKLLMKLQDKNVSEESEQAIRYTDQLSRLSQELDEKNTEIIELKNKIQNFENDKLSLCQNIEKLNEENTVLLSNLAELRNSVTDAIDQRGMEVAEMWKQHLSMRETEFENLEKQLRDELFESENKLKDLMVVLPVDTNTKDDIELVQSIESNDAAIKQKLEEAIKEKDLLKSLYENEKSILIQNLEKYKQEYEELKNLTLLKENEVQLLSTDLKKLKLLQKDDQSTNDKLYELENILIGKDRELQDISLKSQHMEDSYIKKLYDYDVIINNKEIELDNIRQQLCQAEIKFADSTHEHEAELADMRLKSHSEKTSYEKVVSELKNKAENLEFQLEIKMNECKSLNMKIEQFQSSFNENDVQMNELRKALESQEIEIVTLKENLTEQADIYEKLVVEHMHEKYKNRAEKHVTFSEDTKPGAEINEPLNASQFEQSDKPPRADLDLALYMLHQRDVRCEELTVELMQLLEERDTLQLKLSNAIRANEELRSTRSPSIVKSSESSVSLDDLTKIEQSELSDKSSLPVTASEKPSSSERSYSVSGEYLEDKNIPPNEKSLETKLSQLHKVGHMRDIRLRDEREHRMRQMELLQRDVQHLPPEAAARLREAHYTLTRDTQSASTVLLNWLWGKTTPKVVHM